MRYLTMLAAFPLLVACSSGGNTLSQDVGAQDIQDIAHDAGLDAAIGLPDHTRKPDDVDFGDDADAFMLPDPGIEPGCQPGDGCFLDPCSGNDDCLSGWCVGHMGEQVCSQQCESECPPGWSCQQVPGTAPDIVFICISAHANLCLPCATSADCHGTAGETAPCVDYGEQGSFCGGTCTVDEDCPWGFSCQQASTVDDVPLLQCVADAGVCPCTGKSVELGLWTPCEQVSEFGTCGGKRICTDAGLTDCDAPTPAEEVCNGLDDNCDGAVDEATCDDDNECTEDLCLGEEGCTHTPVDGECKDNDPCTVADHCEAGLCVGDAVECDDDNPCTQDICTVTGGCDYEPTFGPCDDGDPCTAGDLCQDGQCHGTPLNCDCAVDADCDALEDGDLCNGTLVCDTSALPYHCAVDQETVITCPEPTGADAPCLAPACDPVSGSCSTVPANDGAPCNDGDDCTMADTCDSGACNGGVPVNCSDANPCTDDACDPDDGCVHTPNNLPCDDNNLCTQDDVCDNGLCLPGATIDCDDDNPCTTDSCDAAGGCTYKMNAAPCDDGNVCTTGDHCHLGECISSGALTCDDNNICTDDACSADTGCVFVPNTADCDDQNPCTVGDACLNGWCSGTAATCNDSNPCTDDGCNPDSGCTYVPNADPCDDANPCTVGDACKDGACVGGDALVCDDDDICTDDSCDPQSGCVFAHNTAPCDDDNACTDEDACDAGVCHGKLILCNDDNPCTNDGCETDTGCAASPVQDETPCGEGLWCQAGECVEKPPQSETFSTLNFNGMSGYPLAFDNTIYCNNTSDQAQMDALCKLAGFDSATNWKYQTMSINTCYCRCDGITWSSPCCSGTQTQKMIVEVTCNK